MRSLWNKFSFTLLNSSKQGHEKIYCGFSLAGGFSSVLKTMKKHGKLVVKKNIKNCKKK